MQIKDLTLTNKEHRMSHLATDGEPSSALTARAGGEQRATNAAASPPAPPTGVAAASCGRKRPRSNGDGHIGRQTQHDVDDDSSQRAVAAPSSASSAANDYEDAAADDAERRRGELSSRRLPLGTFPGHTIYRNSLHGGETFSDGHVSLANLIPPGCSSAFLTTFAGPDPAWMESVFGGTSAVERLILVTHDGREGGKARFVGDGEVVPMIPKIRPHWYCVLAKPHTSGCLHSKLLLFRSPKGLRVVVSGNNLFRGQWEVDRDCLWVQDFFVRERPGLDVYRFGTRLRDFLGDLSACRRSLDHQRLVSRRLNEMFVGIDFATANKARLVISFPRPTTTGDGNVVSKDRGGYAQLAAAVWSVGSQLHTGSDYGSSDGEDGRGDLRRRASDDSGTGGDGDPTVYAMAGSMGDLNPDFLLQMQRAMHGVRDCAVSEEGTSWSDVIGRTRCLWPSRETALTMHLPSLIHHVRPMPRAHWNDAVPEEARRRVFFDAPPNPAAMGLPHLDCHPVSHAKVLYCPGLPCTGGRVGALYVGSHNFSRAAWGLRHRMPKNVEVGVVLGTTSPVVRREWERRLPCLLPGASSASSTADYVPASAHTGVREAYAADGPGEAMRMLKQWLSMGGGEGKETMHGDDDNCDGAKANAVDVEDCSKVNVSSLPEVIDLCNDDSD